MSHQTSHRLQSYAQAAAPVLIASMAAADSFDGYSNTAVNSTNTFAYSPLFTAIGFDFGVYAGSWTYQGAYVGTGGIGIPHSQRADLGTFKFFKGSRTNISYGLSGDRSILGYGGFASNASWAHPAPDIITANGSGYFGLAAKNTSTNDTLSAWFKYEHQWNSSTGFHSLTITEWAYNINNSITMPQNSGGGAVPGLGGLAALACGAGGVRRKRQRVA